MGLTPQAKLQSLVESLKNDHYTLVEALRNITLVDNSTISRQPPTPTIPEEAPSPVFSSKRDSRRTSMASGYSVFYDAEEGEGATEFIMDDDPTPSTTNSRILDGVSETNEPGQDSGDDTDEEVERIQQQSTPTALTHDTQSTRSRTTAATSAPSTQEVVRRTNLPSGPVGDEGSLFAVLKKNIGKVGHEYRTNGLCMTDSVAGSFAGCDARQLQRAAYDA
jgi:hypothetical protein